MPTVEWDIPFSLVTSAGTLTMNATVGTLRYLLNHETCTAAPELRTSVDPKPRTDGATIHSAFKTGYRMNLMIELWLDEFHVALNNDRQAMLDVFDPHLIAMLNADILTDSGGRVIWTPTNYGDDRMLDGCRLLEWPSVVTEDTLTTVTLPLHSRFPYGVDVTPLSTPVDVSGTGTVTVTNSGTAEYWPVFQIGGFTSGFSLVNNTTGLTFAYSDAQPGAQPIGGGDYAEIDMFRNTVYLNGNQDNLMPGVIIEQSDFWSLVPGDNEIAYAGGNFPSLLYATNAWA